LGSFGRNWAAGGCGPPRRWAFGVNAAERTRNLSKRELINQLGTPSGPAEAREIQEVGAVLEQVPRY
jgi:hypothetical protein